MVPPHPLERLSPKLRTWAFVTGCATSAVFIAILTWVDRWLTTPIAPSGIVSFELAGTLEHAQAILASWADPSAATLSLIIDFGFLMAYSTAIALGCVLVTAGLVARERPRFLALGRVLAWGQWLAAVLDTFENVALLAQLGGSTSETWPAMALCCAIPKFALVGLGLGYVVLGGLACLIWKRSPETAI